MERRVTSHTEEEEMNQRRYLLNLARKGDQKAVRKLMELYQVKVYTGENLKRLKMRKLILSSASTKSKTMRFSTKKKSVALSRSRARKAVTDNIEKSKLRKLSHATLGKRRTKVASKKKSTKKIATKVSSKLKYKTSRKVKPKIKKKKHLNLKVKLRAKSKPKHLRTKKAKGPFRSRAKAKPR